METYIHSIATKTPQHCHSQDQICEYMLQKDLSPETERFIKRTYKNSGIDKRYSVLPDFGLNASPKLFRKDSPTPTTFQRNEIFIEESKSLGIEVAASALKKSGFSKQDITHVITVSCTGFYNPGLDFYLVKELRLDLSVERYHLGFMGCYASFPALRMAEQFCISSPDAVVLIVSTELCSLHMQEKTDKDSLVANAIFSDGAASAIVSSIKPNKASPHFKIGSFYTKLFPEGESDMAWALNDHGFEMTLSSYVPRILKANMRATIEESLLVPSLDSVDLWAIHPGGRAILDAAEQSLGINPQQLECSRKILREYGNMSSVTILFVMEELLNTPLDQESSVCGMAFGPGLTIKLFHMNFVPALTCVSSVA